MIRAIAITAAFILVAGVGVLAAPPQMIIPGVRIGPVKLGMSVQQVREAMGRPLSSVGGSKDNPRYNWDVDDKIGWHVDFSEGRAISISFGDTLPAWGIEWKDSQGNTKRFYGVPDEEVAKLKDQTFETPEGVHLGVGMSTVRNTGADS